MADKEAVTKKNFSADWFMRGALAKIGDTLDRFAGRDWQPSSSLATSQLVERLKALLDAEKKEVAGKGFVVPHNIKLKMQWDKFSADAGEAVDKLENELLTAAADHINDNLYYTYAPLHLEVKPDYFTEGVKLLVSFEQFTEENVETEMNVTMPLIMPAAMDAKPETASPATRRLRALFDLGGKPVERAISVPSDGRLTVGRTGSNGLVIDDNSVSKVHASISVNNQNQLSVADTGSTNGTFINGERIAYGKAVTFTADDNVGFGSVEVRFDLIVAEPAPEPDGEGHDSVQIGDFEFTSRTSDAETSAAPVSLSKLDTQRTDVEPAADQGPAQDGEEGGKE